jgi:hypothetical protein
VPAGTRLSESAGGTLNDACIWSIGGLTRPEFDRAMQFCDYQTPIPAVSSNKGPRLVSSLKRNNPAPCAQHTLELIVEAQSQTVLNIAVSREIRRPLPK